jgi:hypothetical protein
LGEKEKGFISIFLSRKTRKSATQRTIERWNEGRCREVDEIE